MLEPGHRLGFLREPLLKLQIRSELRAHDLDGADLVEKAMANLVDRPHASLSDLGEDLVFALDEGSGLAQWDDSLRTSLRRL